ncbi:hypothetical protein [Nocardioides cynanchi]|uniref:hypothetical protein n=1 Tax=Nocardioides cynanchi TaxID=2558918 RepID=UPI001246BC25|nr:hypothetical protein [Nocardioides cynanchi]
MTRSTLGRRTTSAGVLAALVLGATGCGGSSSGSAEPPTSAGTGSTTPSGGPSPPSPSTGPTVPAAGGPKVVLTRFTARAPAGWRLDHSFGREIVFASDRHFVNELSYSDTSIYPGTSPARAERIVARNDDWSGSQQARPRVSLDGRTFFHLTGPAGQGQWYDVYASPDGDRLLQLGFKTDVARPRRERLVASVLASFRLR